MGPHRAERARETRVAVLDRDVQRRQSIRAGLVDIRPRRDQPLRHLHAAAVVAPRALPPGSSGSSRN